MQEKTEKKRSIRKRSLFEHIRKKIDSPMARAGTETLHECAAGLAYTAAAYLLGASQLLFGTHPLGIATLCAANVRIPYILVGLIASAITSTRIPAAYILTYLGAAIMRAVARILFSDSISGKNSINGENDAENKKLSSHMRLAAPKSFSDLKGFIIAIFSESVYLRMMTACVSAFTVCLCTIIAGGFRYYDLFGAIFSIIVCPAAVFVYSGYFEKKKSDCVMYNLAICAIICSLIYSVRSAFPVDFLCVPIALMCSMFTVLYTAKRRGLVMGLILASLCGLACHIVYIPALILAAAVYVLTSHMSSAVSVSLSASAAVVGATVINTDSVLFALPLYPSFILGGLIFYIFEKYRAILFYGNGDVISDDEKYRILHKSIDENERIIAERRLAYNNERLRSMSAAFAELSGIFFNLSDCLRRPATLDLQRICRSAFEDRCRGCVNRDICWGLEYTEMLENVNALTDSLLRRGKVASSTIPKKLLDRCSDIPSILESINDECAKATEAAFRSRKTEVFALDYEDISKILNDTLESDRCSYEPDEVAAQRIKRLIESLNISAQGVLVYGKRKKHIAIRGVRLENISRKSYDLREIIEKECKITLDDPIIEIGNESASLTFSEKSLFSVTHAKAESPSGELPDTSGDTVNLFISNNDYYYSLISDGMGTGRDAAFTSGICSVFLEKMLGAGNSIETSLRMLNNFIRTKDSSALECCATIDLMEFDMTDGYATFVKSGAAPTFVLSGNKVEVIKTRTAPIGIIKSIDTGLIRYRLSDGDTVVMLSDGIVGDDNEIERVAEYLRRYGNDTYPDGIARELIRQARESGSHDDMSVIVTRINRAAS